MCAWGSGRLHLDLQGGLSVALATLSINESVHHVIVRKSMSYSGGGNTAIMAATTAAVIQDNNNNNEEECNIWKAIGQLPNLTHLEVADFENEALSVKGLALALQEAQQLTTLKLDSVGVTGNDNDYALLEVVLANHQSLSHIHFIGCFPSHNNNTTNSYNNDMDALAIALARVPHLREVEIYESRFMSIRAWTGHSLAQLCQSSSIQCLRIRGFRFLTDEQVTIFAESLMKPNRKSGSRLTELHLACDIRKSGVAALCQLIRSKTKLQILEVNGICDNDHGHNSQSIANALSENTSLKELGLIFQHGFTGHLQECFEDLLYNKNYTLEKISGSWTSPTIDFLLRMNQLGRGSLLVKANNATKMDWINTMALQHEDLGLSSSFYLLSQNPSLCSAT